MSKDSKEEFNAIILTTRSVIRDAVRGALKDSGFVDERISFPEKARECLTHLKDRNQCILVVDWEVGTEEALEVLSSTHKNQQQDLTVMFLIAAKMSEKIIAAGTEYGVSQIHTGDITKDKVKITLKKLLEELKNLTPIKKLLIGIGEARLKGNWAAATEILQQLFEKDPQNRRVRLELAENCLHEKQWDRAHELLKDEVSKTPQDARALHLLGKCLLKRGQPEMAVNVFRTAKVLNPFNVDRLLELGNALLEADRSKEARENFDELIAIAPRNKQAKQGKGTCMLMDGEVNEALALLKDNITGMELASVFNTAAVLSMRKGQIPQGMNLYDAAVTALKNNKEALSRLFYNKGIGFFRWKKLDEARVCFEKSVELDPTFANAIHNLKSLSARTKVKMAVGSPVSPMGTVTFDDSMDAFTELTDEDERI